MKAISALYLVTSERRHWETSGVRFWAPQHTMGPGAATVSADPRKAVKFKLKSDAEEEARFRHGLVVTEDEAWALVIEYPLPNWANHREELIREAERRVTK